MIPIKYRLDAAAEKEYIEKAFSCIKETDRYSNKLHIFLINMDREGWAVGKKILNDAQRFRADYPGREYLCRWLVMSQEEMTEIRKYLDGIIQSDLSRMNAILKSINGRIAEIRNYHGLKYRRTRYAAGGIIGCVLSTKVRYDAIFNSFAGFNAFYENWTKTEINYWIVEKTGLKVCPYCNISYTYNRGETVTVQLDHFFPKSEYPVFALCFYNLVPSCPACNKIKHDDAEEMVSPYKGGAFEKLRITWDYGGKDKYDEKNSLAALEKMIEIKIETSRAAEQHNLTTMKIKEAYQQHRDYASEIIRKARTYTNPDTQKLICDIGASMGIRPDEVERFYLGNYLEEDDLGKRPLSKMTRDFYREIADAARKGAYLKIQPP